MNKIYDIVIAGSGPSGISIALESKLLGIENTIILEKTDGISDTIRKYYKDGKRVDKDYKGQKVELKGNIAFNDCSKEETLDLFENLIKQNNLNLKLRCEVDNITKNDDIFCIRTTNNEEIKAKFVAITIGKMGTPNKPSYKIPLDIRNKVFFNANSILPNEKILVVGGGNSAVEYALALINSNDVMLNYRKNEFTRINDINNTMLQSAIKNNQLKHKLGVDIVSLEVENGKPKVNFTDNEILVFDKIIYAIGGVAPIDFLKKCKLQLDDSNIPIVSDVYESSIKNLFVAGDLLTKSGASIAFGIQNGFTIANEINNRIKR